MWPRQEAQRRLYFLAPPQGRQDLSSPTRDQTHALYSENAES